MCPRIETKVTFGNGWWKRMRAPCAPCRNLKPRLGAGVDSAKYPVSKMSGGPDGLEPSNVGQIMLRPWHVNIVISRRSRTAVYLQIAHAIIDEVRRGRLA